MGLLDDAIREHLELKRKHGAAEDDLRRQEVEALGPARRDFSADAGAAPDEAEPASDERVAAEPELVPEPAGWLDEEPLDAPEDPLPAPDPAPVAEAPAPLAEERSAPVAPGAPRESDTPTQGFDALSLDDDEPAPEGEEDVLEETPDFLQDTPEHDRLWFEQKPPRDFDFDG